MKYQSPFSRKNKKNISLSSAEFTHRGVGWSGVAKMSCILHHQGIQLILAYSWARSAILVAD